MIELDGINFRDIGGLRTTDGRRIIEQRIFRSGRLTGFSRNNFCAINSLGIRVICDLRSQTERRQHPGPDEQQWAGNYLQLNIDSDVRGKTSLFSPLEDKPTAASAQLVMESVYRSFPETFAPHLRDLFDRIANDGTPVIVHCTAGKDRTGFVIAMLLLALGVDTSAVFDDYLRSSVVGSIRVLRDEVSDLLASRIGRRPTEEVVQAILGVDRKYLAASFDEIARVYGSVNDYLQIRCHIDPTQIVRLRSLFLEDC